MNLYRAKIAYRTAEGVKEGEFEVLTHSYEAAHLIIDAYFRFNIIYALVRYVCEDGISHFQLVQVEEGKRKILAETT